MGIDPSVSSTAVVATEGSEHIGTTIIKPAKGLAENRRYLNIAEQVLTALVLYAPNTVGIEGFSLNSRGAGVSKMYGVGWAIRFVMMYNEYDFAEVPPSTWKKYVGGKARKKGAGKPEISAAVLERWGYSHTVQDAYDAYAISRLMGEYAKGSLLDTDTYLTISKATRANAFKISARNCTKASQGLV